MFSGVGLAVWRTRGYRGRMHRSARIVIVIALCAALVSSLSISATAAPAEGQKATAATIAKKKKKRCRKGYVRKRVTVKKGRNRGKRVSRCVKKRKPATAPRKPAAPPKFSPA